MTGDEEDKDVENEHARSPSPDVKSKAVVKYTAVKCPTSFSKLQCNTDLKMPPSNWLSSATDSYGLRHSLVHSAGFSSFKMAHMFPDCVGEVDVVSGAECIKNLLKLPYHPTGVISMMVHRIENTLLLDDFDIFQYLMKSELSWMKKFFYEKSISTKDGVVYLKNKSRYALEQKSLVSKFLYHSLPSKSDTEDDKELQCPTLPLSGPSLPEPDFRKAVPYPNFSNHTYNRNVVWTFEDIQMLIGSDMPIFGGVDRPCVSLRLRDATEPINVLTGIDYWLDNLMCNVPEVIMCYHLDGIVSKYEPIKTEDLPNLKDSKFSPKVIKNVAQNILSFLKSKATKAGHTYWLFKGMNDDVVKLYDLTTLCGTVENSTDQNPFTVPVAMLLYRVARNMKIPCQSGHVKLLLENCIKLLDKEKYPHIVASSHYMLANLYVPSLDMKGSTNECECGDPKTCRRQEDFEDDETAQDPLYTNTNRNSEKSFDSSISGNLIGNQKPPNDSNLSDGNKNKSNKMKNDNQIISGDVAVRSLIAPSSPLTSQPAPPPIIDEKIEDRCLLAIKHVKDGLCALKHFIYNQKTNQDDESSTRLAEEQNPKMAKSFEPIPMGYESLHPNSDNCKMASPNTPIPMPYVQKDSELEQKVSKQDRSSRRRKKESKNKKRQLESQNKSTQDVENTKKMDGALLPKDNTIPTWEKAKNYDDASWKIHLKTLLYEKACIAYIRLSEQYYDDEQHGVSFKFIVLAQKCYKVLASIVKNSNIIDESCLLVRAGDNLFQIAKNWEKFQNTHLQQITCLSEADKFIQKEIDDDIEMIRETLGNAYDMVEFEPPKDLDDAIITCEDYYNKAFNIAPSERKNELYKRIASVKNELGVKYMYNAQEEYSAFCNLDESEVDTSKEPLFETLSKKALQYLTESAKIFEKLNDLPNLALLHCNTGRFMRFRAHCNLEDHSPAQKKFYNLAIEHYSQALRMLCGRDSNHIRDLVQWELSSALFTQACHMQDYPPNTPDAASEAVEALRNAIRSCPLVDGPRQCLYQFRAASLYQRLASLYHKQFRDPFMEPAKAKAACALGKLNYEHAMKLLLTLEEGAMYLGSVMELVALLEHQSATNQGMKTRSLQSALEILQGCEPVLKSIIDKITTSRKEETEALKSNDEDKKKTAVDKTAPVDNFEGEFGMFVMYEQRLQFVLKSLIQIYLQKQGAASKKDNEKLLSFYKKFYSLVLKIGKFTHEDVVLYAQNLYDILINVKNNDAYS